MFSVLFRIPADKTTTLFETDDRTEAAFVLQGAVTNPETELIDFSPELDGALDYVLMDVTLTDHFRMVV